MAPIRSKNGKKKNGIVKFKVVVEKLQRSLLLGKKSACDDQFEDVDEEVYDDVPQDVKEGHFVVKAEDENEVKRFVVPLSYLTHPSLLVLLQQVGDEYGFQHGGGALTIPCRPSELEMILAEKWASKTMVRSC